MTSLEKKPASSKAGKDLAFVEKALAYQELGNSERGYVTRLITQLSLPYKDPSRDPSVNVWVRRNGPVQLVIYPEHKINFDGTSKPLFPYGKYPRLILPWLITQVVVQSRELDPKKVLTEGMNLDLGDSLRGFLTTIGAEVGGNTARLVLDQSRRLFRARFAVSKDISVPGKIEGDQWASFQIADEHNVFWSVKETENISPGLFGNQVHVTPMFVSEILRYPIPIDLKALSILSDKGPLAMDIYTWLNYRLPNMKESCLIPWELLAQQFGSQYGRMRAFKDVFIKQLKAVTLVYPKAQVTPTDKGLLIKASPPAISRNSDNAIYEAIMRSKKG